jgi:hypothetical protein
MAVALVACSAGEKAGFDIAGTWTATKADVTNIVSYLTDGTFQGRLSKTTTNATLWNYEGRWKIEGEWLRYSYTKSDSERVRAGYGDADKILEVSAYHFKIQTSTGEERTYTRMSR